jgi:putative drug exporter of the RND superfamily
MYRALARWCFRRAWVVVAIWVVALVGTNALAAALGPAFSSELNTPASESRTGLDVLEASFPGAAGAFGGSLVFASDDGVLRPEVTGPAVGLLNAIDDLEGLTVVSPFGPGGESQVSADGTVAYARLSLDSSIDPAEAVELGAEMVGLFPTIDGTRIEMGGSIFSEVEPPETEIIGLAFAVVILIVAFGSVLAMGLPIGVALAGVGTGGLGLVALLGHVTSIPEAAPIIGIMIGLGVGIDYALFIVTRYRELTRSGVPPETAMTGALDTAGRAVVFAGITVVFSLLGMLLIGLDFVSGMGISAAATVTVTLVASVTLLPALIGLTHTRIERTRLRGLLAAGFVALALLGVGLGLGALAATGAILAFVTVVASFAVAPLRRELPQRRHRPLRDTLAYRWSRLIQARPILFVLVGGGVLLVATIPVFSLQLGFSDEGNNAPGTTTREAYDLVADGFGPGANGPIVVVVEVDGPDAVAAARALPDAIAADAGVAQVSPAIGSDLTSPDASGAFIIQVIPTSSPQDAATAATVERLRSDVVATVVANTGAVASVTGSVAVRVDFVDYLSGRLLVFFAAVLGVSFVLLTMVFRSLLVPLKAVVMNVLSIAAAYGVVVAIFQWGWLGSVFGVQPAPIEPFVPIMLFAIVFGLSMDYEVFLLSRIKEEYVRTGDAVNSVADGLAATARVITAAAAIMVVVFGAFLLEDDRIIKVFGVGLAVAVLLDATLVRMVLVPATMELLGARNWWIPRWLDRVLPHLNVEGPDAARAGALAADAGDVNGPRGVAVSGVPEPPPKADERPPVGVR